MPDQSVSVVVSADASAVGPAIDMSAQLVAQLEQVVQQQAALVTASAASADALTKLAGAEGAGTAATQALGEAHAAAATEAVAHGVAEEAAALSTEKASMAVNAAARAFGALGIGVGEASERVLAFSEGLEAVGKTAGPLLAVGAAFLAVGAAVNFAADGLKDFAHEQDNFASLETAIKNQGGDWDEAKESIERFAVALQATTTFSKGEAISAINQLVTSGLDYAYAEHVVSVATDVAAAKHISLTEAVDRLQQAIAGHNRGLLELDPTLATLIARHADLQEIVDHLARTFDGQAVAATRKLDGATAQLSHDVASLGADMMSFVAGPLDAFVHGIDEAVRAFKSAADLGVFSDNSSAALGFGLGYDLISGPKQKPTGDATKPERNVNVKADEEAARAAAEAQNDAVHRRIEMVSELFRTQRMGYDEALHQEDELKTRYHLTTAQLQDLTLATLHLADERNRMAEEAARKSAAGARAADRAANKAPWDFDPGEEPAIRGDDAYAVSQKGIEAALARFKSLEDEKAEAIKLATTAQGEEAAKTDLANQKTKDATAAIDMLVGSLTRMETQRAQLQATERQETAAADAAWKTYVNYGDALSHIAGGPSEAQKAALADLKKNFDALHQSADATGEKIRELTGFINTDTESLRTWNGVLQQAPEDLAARWREFNDEVAKGLEMLDKPSKATLDAQAQRQADQAALQDELTTYGMSLQAQLAFYQQRYAQEVAADGLYSDEASKTLKKIDDLELDEYKQRIEAHQEMLKQIETDEENALEKLLDTTGSFGERLKSVWKDIGQQLEKSWLSSLFNPGGTTGGTTTPGGPLGGFTNLLGSIFGPSSQANANAPSAIVNPLNDIRTATQTMAARMTSAVGSGSGDDVANAGSQYGLVGVALGETGAQQVVAALPTSDLTSLFIGPSNAATSTSSSANSGGSIGWVPTNPFAASGSSLKTYASSAIQGAGEGSSIAGALGENTSYGSLGGAVGSALGTWIGTLGGATGGPLGAAIGTVLGSVIGGLFGPNWGPPSNYPDRSQPGYGQWLTNYQGQPAEVNGQWINPQGPYWEALGGQSIEANIGQWVAQNANNTSLSAPLEALLQQFEALGGTNPGRDLGIESEKNGIFTLWSGAQIPVTQLEQLVTEYQTLLGTNGSTSVYSLERTYPNYVSQLSPNPVGTMGQNGVYTPASGSTSSATPTATVNIEINNPIGTIPDEVAVAFAQKLKDLGFGIVPGAPAYPLGQRVTGSN